MAKATASRPPAELSPSFCTTTFLRNCGTPAAAAAAASSTLQAAANTFFPVSFAPAAELDFPLFSLDLEDRDRLGRGRAGGALGALGFVGLNTA